MEILDYIIENRIILVPVLYTIGEFIKKLKFINNDWIPIILLFFGILFSIFMGGETLINNIIQGILVAGITVFGKKLIKSNGEDDQKKY